MRLIVHTPINSLSLGNTGYNFLKSLFRAKHEVGLFIIGQPDFSAFKPPAGFMEWVQESVNRRYEILAPDVPALTNWHLSGSEKVFSAKQILCTYHETSQATLVEVSIAKNQFKTLFCGGYSSGVFQKAGVNAGSFNLGLDDEFKVLDKTYYTDRAHWVVGGKFEQRKFTDKLIKLWVDKYGNKQDHVLTLLVTNPFFGKDEQESFAATNNLIQQCFGGKRYWNVNILPRLKTNAEVNDLINSVDIDLSGLGSESWSLPSFNAACLGKWPVVLGDSGQSAWVNENNSIIVNPCGMRPAHDGFFFKTGGEINQGEFFDVSDDAIIDAFERAEKKVGEKNQNGLDMGVEMTYDKSVEEILSNF